MQVKGQIIEMEDNIDRLRNAIAAKEDPLKLAETRLDNRQYRPNVELCRDPVQFRLVEEVGQIETNIARLQQRLGQTLESLKGLERRKLELEDEIAIKENTLRIDEAECQALRKSIHIQAY
jgi:tektin-1